MLKFDNETNWANNVLGLRRDYKLPLNDDNIKKMFFKAKTKMLNIKIN